MPDSFTPGAPSVRVAEPGQPVRRTVRSGALSAGDLFRVVLQDRDDLRAIEPADRVTIISPKEAAGNHANLTVRPNGAQDREVPLLGGGNNLTIEGPLHSVVIEVRDNPVAGSGDDDLTLIFEGRDRLSPGGS